MSKILNIDDMLDIGSQNLEMTELVEAVEAAATALAKGIAKRLDIEHGEATYESGFGGLCANFKPKYEGQECPTIIDEGDPEGDWE